MLYMHNELANLTPNPNLHQHIKATMKTSQDSPSSEKLLEGEEKQCLKEPPAITMITTKKLAFIPLLFLIYFQVSGGPYGTETMVGAGGTFYAILGIIFFPILWSVPEALITAELSTAFPGNGGFVIWTHQAFGPFWGFLIGFWNCWDNVSTLVRSRGVTQPSKTLPKAFLSSGLITCFAHLIPLLASIGAIKIDLDDWVDGYYTIVGEKIVGKKFKRWIRIGAFLSGIGVFQSQLSSCSYQLLGMTELGLLPTFFSARSKRFNTPWVGILISTDIDLNFKYEIQTCHIISECFLQSGDDVRIRSFYFLEDEVSRSGFKVPLTKLRSLIAMCFIPFWFLLYVVFVGQPIVYLVVALLTMLGILWYYCMRIVA
ncbi:probable polyamine transporter At3g13620 [Rosa rugosa]|uniref:probable polyamine transporter At3g13620 n=1 Tax=Rosa rugosa TaxID=74645 RepID=UPI002B408F5A|nr:probable polyamine transporter At3g13620 [Rosa rugosa]